MEVIRNVSTEVKIMLGITEEYNILKHIHETQTDRNRFKIFGMYFEEF